MSETNKAVRDLPDPPRRGLSWEDVEVLRRAGLHNIADIAERYLRKRQPWWRRRKR